MSTTWESNREENSYHLSFADVFTVPIVNNEMFPLLCCIAGRSWLTTELGKSEFSHLFWAERRG